jgi:hypothetical protein
VAPGKRFFAYAVLDTVGAGVPQPVSLNSGRPPVFRVKLLKIREKF